MQDYLLRLGEIYRGHDVQTLAKRYGLEAICRSDMTEPVHKEIPVVVLDTIGGTWSFIQLRRYHFRRWFSC